MKALKAIWDLDHVAQKGAWELLISEAEPEELIFLEATTNQGRGTLVRWEKVDRLLKEYSDPSGRHARNALDRRIDELVEHVSMVYQRFLNDSDQREDQNVQMWINGSEIKPWDPFCTNEAELTAQETIPIGHEDNDDVLGEFSIRAFVLPRKGQYSSDEVEKSAKISNDRQGFYIYRENRLIHHADWLGMYSKEPHFSLLRVEFSFGAELDEAFQVDIKKSKISLADELYRWLKDEFLPAPRRAAEQLYRKGVKVGVTTIATGAHDASNKGIGNTEKDIPQATVNVIDPDSDEVDVSNLLGTTRIKLKIGKAKKPGEVYVQPVDGIDDGLLWQPAYIDEHQAVQINTGHQFYRKVYVPNIQSNGASPINVQGLDSLLWALSVSELKAVNADTITHFEELRYDVSRILRKLVEDLPEPNLEDNNA